MTYSTSVKRTCLVLVFTGLLLGCFYLVNRYHLFTWFSTPDSAAVPPAMLGNFSITSPSKGDVLVDAPRLLTLSLSEIEAIIGKPVNIESSGDKEERLYYLKYGTRLDDIAEVRFGYDQGKPHSCRLLLNPFPNIREYEAFRLIGVDKSPGPTPEIRPTIPWREWVWRNGIFEDRLYDLSIVYGHVDDVTAGGYAAAVGLEIHD